MSDQSGGPAATGTPALSTDDLFEALASQPRRVALFHLRQHGAATVDELVEVVSDLTDIGETVGADRPDRLAVVLVEHHLPLLERNGLVVHDRLHDTVELAGTPADLGDWLDLAVRRELRWPTGEDEGEPAEAESRQLTVLVVDDEPGLAEVIAEFIENRHDDISVATATNAPDAFTLIGEIDIDCVVSDYRMPAIDGLEFLDALREERPDLPFVLFTNKGSEEVASQAIAKDVTAYVPKGQTPEQYDRLATQIREAVTARPED